ncbi:MAG: carbohydrate ABC transporter permease, partial [Thermotogaceae bacterium]|nr:carbohydrate ABC transporter permease [Thermotogaceae bacterium]
MKRKRKWLWTSLAFISTFIIVLPLYFIAIGGFESIEEIFHKPPYIFPPNPEISYYKEALLTLLPYMKNSFIISFGTLAIVLLVSLPAAFVLSKFRLSLNKAVLNL